MKAVNILWDTDGENPEDFELPTEVNLPKDIEIDEVTDWLSDTYGFRIKALSFE